MSQIAINFQNSIFLDDDGQIAVISNTPSTSLEEASSVANYNNAVGEATRQDILERLSTWQGEDWINRLFGIPYTSLFEDQINITYFITDLQRNILQCFGVISLLDFTWNFGEIGDVSRVDVRQSRELNVSFTVQSTSGQLTFSTRFPTQGNVMDNPVIV